MDELVIAPVIYGQKALVMNVVLVFEDILREKQKGEIEEGFPVWGILAMGVLGPPLAVGWLGLLEIGNQRQRSR